MNDCVDEVVPSLGGGRFGIVGLNDEDHLRADWGAIFSAFDLHVESACRDRLIHQATPENPLQVDEPTVSKIVLITLCNKSTDLINWVL